jgi:uncharacterized caspase-like protein
MSLRFLVKVAALASTCLLSVSQAMAESRLALVIGNSNYSTVSALPNPANDAKAMTNFLTSAGFEVVQAPDLTQSDMRRTIGNFAKTAADKGPDTVVLVFYAGHGLQVDGENFLVPVDAQIEREADVPFQAMRLADVMNALSTIPSKSRIVILDACRNNPFSKINKTSGRGLAIVDAPNGSLVSYSTAPGTEALDGDGQNSPYTAALTKIGHEPGLPIEQLLKRVRLDVSNTTDKQQFPWESSSLTTEFSFFPGGAGQERTAAATGTQPGATGKPRSETRSVESWQKELKPKGAREAYDIVVREDQVEAYQAYLALYPSQPAAPVVRNLVDRRKVVIAWYTAVTVNTVASYQVFLASYGNSDFALTADRLLERASTRSISDAGAAFAATAPTCPCTVPATPTLRQRRTDTAPTQNTGSKTTKTPGSNVAIVDPTPAVTVNPVPPPVIVVPPRISIPKPPRDKHKPPRGDDHPKSTGDGKGGKGGKTTTGTYGSTTTNNPQILRGQVNTKTRHVNTNAATTTATKPPGPSPFSIGIGIGIGLGGGRSAAPHQSGGSRGMGHVR